MKLIRKTKREKTKGGFWVYFAIFLCPFCLQEVEKRLSCGKRDRSCGCIHNKDINNNNYKHGETNTKLYKIYNSMKQRVFNPKNKDYLNYGGRGIAVCPEWTESYIKFRDWSLNNGYTDNLEIDRINNDGNYEPSNCRFVTHKENMKNTRQCKINIQKANEIRELYKTDKYTQKELGEMYDLKQNYISKIINNKTWENLC